MPARRVRDALAAVDRNGIERLPQRRMSDSRGPWPWHFPSMSKEPPTCRSRPNSRPATHEQWRKLVDAVLKGRSVSTTLVSKTYDGLRIAAAL